MFTQTLKDVEKHYRDDAGFDVCHDEFEELWTETWRDEEQNKFSFARFKIETEGKQFLCNESYKTFIECTPELNLFEKLNTIINFLGV